MPASQASTPSTGHKAPDFNTTDQHGNPVRLNDFRGKYVVLYFYPKDNTPGCTVEAKEFRDRLADIAACGAAVLGVSPDSAASHCKFIERLNLNFPLLVDESHEIAEAYGVWAEKSMFGKKFMGVRRSTFLIGPDGTLLRAWLRVQVDGHATEVMRAIQELKG